jgi:hypothetical protein
MKEILGQQKSKLNSIKKLLENNVKTFIKRINRDKEA